MFTCISRRFALLCPIFVAVITTAPAVALEDEGSEPTQLAIVRDDRIDEASGMAMSIRHPGAVWMHNDSGDTARLFLVGMDGLTQAVVSIRGIKPFDWEDMCSFSLDGENWLLVADIGDNARRRQPRSGSRYPVCRLLLIRERTLDPPPKPGVQRSASWIVHSILDFEYEDGPRDCESVAVDTASRRILLVSKTLPTDCALYQLPLILERGQHTATASRIATIGIPFATAMDISPQNDRMVIVTMWTGVLIERKPDEDWQTAVRRPARNLLLPPRRQGETVCFTADGEFLLLNSEGRNQPLWQMHVPRAAGPALP